ncbi:hypothetical protein Tco_1567403, partial [Tanacetum coccineum]
SIIVIDKKCTLDDIGIEVSFSSTQHICFSSCFTNTYAFSHAVPPPYTRNFMPHKYDLILADEGEYVFSESVTSIPDAATNEAKTSMSKPKSVDELLIED